MEMESPPNYIMLAHELEPRKGECGAKLRDLHEEDRRRIKALPPEALEELKQELQRQMAVYGGVHWFPDGDPCIWLDMETRRCRFYEHRPVICSDDDNVVIGSESCLSWRRKIGIGQDE